MWAGISGQKNAGGDFIFVPAMRRGAPSVDRKPGGWGSGVWGGGVGVLIGGPCGLIGPFAIEGDSGGGALDGIHAVVAFDADFDAAFDLKEPFVGPLR